jgi:mRNA degradation ribonuclease J1/J2
VSHPHPDLTPPGKLPRNGLRIVPLGGLGEIGRNMTVFEYRGRLLIVVCVGLFRNQGAVMTKAALDLLGLPGGAVRLPLLAATDAERHQLALDLTAGGVKL